MPEQSEGNNRTSIINVFPVLHTIFFLLAGQKVDLYICPLVEKIEFYDPLVKKIISKDRTKVIDF